MKNIALKDDNLYYIGGIVRDEILGKECFDIDLTYQGNAIEYCKNLEAQGKCKILQINEPFGTVKILIDGEETDIASTRDEIYEKKGHLPTVSNIGCSLKQDVLRRDFTINALAKSTLTGEIIDYTEGVNDIKNKTLRILHDNSFIDDPTRIVRGLKFSVRFGFELDKHTQKLQDEYLRNVNYDMSMKRLKKELIETFNLNSQAAYEKFFAQKIYNLLTKEEVLPPKYNIENLVNNYPVKNIWLVYIGWMDLEQLPLTKEEQKIIDDYKILISSDIKNDNYEIYKLFEGKSKEAVLLYTVTTGKDFGLKFFEIADISVSVNGNDLQNLGVPPSKKYTECFDFILKEKLKNPNITKNDELELAKTFFGL